MARYLDITVLEFYPIYYCDNIVVVSIIIEKSLKSFEFNRGQYIYLRPKHLPGVSNVYADKTTRFEVDPQLLQQYGLQLEQLSILDCLLPEHFRL